MHDLPGILLHQITGKIQHAGVGQVLSRKLLLVDCLTGRFHQVKLRTRAADCLACGPKAAITASSLAAFDYNQFTGQAYDDR